MGMTVNKIMATGAILSGLGVMAGAFGAHMLEERLSSDLLDAYKTAVFYQLFHSLVLIVLGVIMMKVRLPNYISILFVAGILFFSGSIYVLVLAQGSPLAKLAGPITPLGGTLFIIAWLILAYHLWKSPQPTN